MEFDHPPLDSEFIFNVLFIMSASLLSQHIHLGLGRRCFGQRFALRTTKHYLMYAEGSTAAIPNHIIIPPRRLPAIIDHPFPASF